MAPRECWIQRETGLCPVELPEFSHADFYREPLNRQYLIILPEREFKLWNSGEGSAWRFPFRRREDRPGERKRLSCVAVGRGGSVQAYRKGAQARVSSRHLGRGWCSLLDRGRGCRDWVEG